MTQKNTVFSKIKNSLNNKINTKNCCTVIKDDDLEVLEIMQESLKSEEILRTKRAQREGTSFQEGSCFKSALRGSKILLEAQGHTLKKTINPKRK